MRRLLPILAAAGLVAALVIGLTQASSGGPETGPPFDLAKALVQLKGAPAPLAALHAQPAALLDGGNPAFRARLKVLRGHPVVVNKWASWCGPCRAEFPVFQRLSTRLGKDVAFVGLNSADNRDDARGFLHDFPVPYPSYVDPGARVARANGAGDGNGGFPTTVFFDRSGRRAFVHQGQYRDQADLAADIKRYAP